jgi:predicted double-glycine peptidase
MSQQERGSYSLPSERSITDSMAQQLGVSAEAAKTLYQKILLEQLKAEDFDNVFEQGDASSTGQAAIENLLNSYLNGNK